jgi:hypothetical protein
MVEATMAPSALPAAQASLPAAPTVPVAEAPLFASPVAKAVYIQVGAR